MFHEPLEDSLETDPVFFAKRTGLIRIDVENRYQLAIAVEDWNDYLRARPGVTADVAGKCIYVFHYYGSLFPCSSSADSATELYLHTAEGPLVRTYAQQLAGRHHTIEAGPQMAESIVDQRTDRCHRRDRVIHSLEHSLGLTAKLFIRFRQWHASQIDCCMTS